MSFRFQRLLGGVAAGALLVAGLTPMPAMAATTWTVGVGANSQGQAIQANAFYANNITIDVGDTVDWQWTPGEIHTVTFLPPGVKDLQLFQVLGTNCAVQNCTLLPTAAAGPSGGSTYDGSAGASSGVFGFIPGLTDYSLTFTKAGTYTYVCLVHDDMQGTVTVNAANTPYPATQADYNAQGQALQTRLLAQGTSQIGMGLGAAAPGNVSAGFGLLLPNVNATLALLRFEPTTRYVQYVHAGDTVTFTNPDPQTPHTVTFGAPPAGGALAAYNASNNVTCTTTECDATISSSSALQNNPVNSGFLANDPVFQKSNTFKATFMAPGTYNYVCALHGVAPADLGMAGSIVVLP